MVCLSKKTEKFIEEDIMEWISVKDRLPDKLYHCLIYYCEDWNYDKTWKIGFCFFNSNKEFCIENSKVKPIHWMPLPKPPQQENN